MIEIKNKYECYGCTACYAKCPVDAINMIEDDEGFKYPRVDYKKCIKCGLCKKVCPYINYKLDKNKGALYYAAINKDKDIVKTSSSGGVFTSVSDFILDKNGFVYGVGYNNDFEVIHKEVKDKKSRDELKGSKYVQSDLGDTFIKIKLNLDNNKNILFVGTPCQVSGLNKFLGKKYENLITMDFVCHGTPSPGLWKKYINYIKQEGKLCKFEFRNKKNGWHNSSVYYNLNNKEVYESLGYNQFVVIYSSHFINRPSCHKCKFTSYNRVSDITVSDFWNIKEVKSVKDDNTGISMIILNTEKGKQVFEDIKNKLEYYECTKEQTYQPQLEYPNKESVLRRRFIKDYKHKSIEYILNKYAPHSFIGKVKKKALYYLYYSIGVIRNGKKV